MNPLVVLLFFPTLASAGVRCAQCNGWHGKHPLDMTIGNSCDNRNNQCQTDNFCVKIVDPMAPWVHYTTFKSDCWFQNTVQVTPSNLTTVVDKACYSYQDASVPSKRWTYCFCNDRDYCNSSGRLGLSFVALVLLLLQL